MLAIFPYVVFKIFTWFQDAQNKVAAYALYKLFPEVPVHLPVTEPYASFILKWMEGCFFLSNPFFVCKAHCLGNSAHLRCEKIFSCINCIMWNI